MFDFLTDATSTVSSWFGDGQPAPAPAPAAVRPPPAPLASTTPAPAAHEEPAGELAPAAAGPAQPHAAAPDPAVVSATAAQLFKAMDGWGTDESSIHNALRGKSSAEIAAIRAAYADQRDPRAVARGVLESLA